MRKFSRRFWIMSATAVLAATLMVVVIVAGASARPRDRAARATPPTTGRVIRSTAPTTTTIRPTTTTRPAPTPTIAIALTRQLAEGMTGADVFRMQVRLVRLGYWLQDPAGDFGEATEHAVIAFEKANSFTRDGIVDAGEWKWMLALKRPVPRTPTGHVYEVDLQRQILLDVDHGRVTWVFDVSTGRIPGTTPVGHFQVYQQVDGWVHGTLGTLYRPKFFSGNVGIHGNSSVPAYPASHGCVRVFNGAMDQIWAGGDLPLGTAVWVY